MKNKIAMKGLVIGALSVFTSSVIAAESLVNLKTVEAGIYEISVSALSDFGVNLEGQNASELAVTNLGEAIQIEVTGGPELTASSTIRFIAEQIDTLYTGENVYTLSLDASLAKRVVADSSPIPSRVPTATSFLRTVEFAPQTRYSFTSPNDEDAFYAKRMVTIGTPMTETIDLELENVAEGGNTGGVQAKLTVDAWGGADQPGVAQDHSLTVGFNGAEVVAKRFDGLGAEKLEANLEQVRLGNNVVSLNMPLDTGYNFDAINVNSVKVAYPSKFIVEKDRLDFESTFSKFRVSGFSADSLANGSDELIVMREDEDGVSSIDVKQTVCRDESCIAQFGGVGKVAHYYVTSESALLKPELSALPVEQDINSGNANYLIISHPDFIGAAGGFHLEDLQTELSSQMGSVDIVDVESIYAEYGHHVFDPYAIKRYIKFAYENRGTRYVLLVGGDVYDYRQFENEDATSFIPSIYAATGNNISYAPVDAKYVDVDDVNVPKFPISRLPVRSVDELASLMQKRQDYIARDYAGTALLVADDYDSAQQYDFASDADEVSSEYLSDFQIEKAYTDDIGTSAARAKIRSDIAEGVTLTSFFGHSSTNQWSFNGLFTGPDAARLENAGKPTVVMQWGCWNAYYVSPNEDSMGHRFLMEGDRGAVSVMGATTLTNADSERKLARLVFERLANGERLGDAVTNAKQDYAVDHPNDLDVLLGWTILGFVDLLVN